MVLQDILNKQKQKNISWNRKYDHISQKPQAFSIVGWTR